MTDYIEREAFIEDIKTEITNLKLNGWKGTPRPCDELYGFIDRIKEQPAADVAPVVHGNWIKHDDFLGRTVECSECHSETMGDTPYCPACGAKMDGKGEEA